MAQIDLQMQEVLDVFEELGPKPIEQLDPTEARQQSTPADAAMRAVEKRGDTPEPDYPAAHDDAFAAYR